MIAGMVSIQIQLTDAQAQALTELAAIDGKSVGQLVRDVVGHLLRARGMVDRQAAKTRSIAAIGRFKSTVRDLGARHDDHLTT